MKKQVLGTGILLRGSVLLMWVYVALSILSAFPIFHGKYIVQYRYHQRLPYPLWSVLQPVPAMYNFENSCTIVGYQDTREITRKQIWVNHHSLRLIYEDRFRKPATESAMEYTFTSLSGTNAFQSRYKLERKDDHTFQLIYQ